MTLNTHEELLKPKIKRIATESRMPMRDTVLTYRLRPQSLKDYLRQVFNQDIPVYTAPDGRSFYHFNVPRKLYPDEKEYIYKNLRYKEDEDSLW
ncbi:hypothetical protein F4781DRAFT_406411 [Annulohypoxylon bovei var. microspora]|nr:hypothetical protein F4781DRAFT_406411 [Annulohypoxylon bovei var. microspora]